MSRFPGQFTGLTGAGGVRRHGQAIEAIAPETCLGGALVPTDMRMGDRQHPDNIQTTVRGYPQHPSRYVSRASCRCLGYCGEAWSLSTEVETSQTPWRCLDERLWRDVGIRRS
ncbi:MAG: hypothetical protein QXI97_05910 [Nitrososphaerota archaeon]